MEAVKLTQNFGNIMIETDDNTCIPITLLWMHICMSASVGVKGKEKGTMYHEDVKKINHPSTALFYFMKEKKST